MLWPECLKRLTGWVLDSHPVNPINPVQKPLTLLLTPKPLQILFCIREVRVYCQGFFVVCRGLLYHSLFLEGDPQVVVGKLILGIRRYRAVVELYRVVGFAAAVRYSSQAVQRFGICWGVFDD